MSEARDIGVLLERLARLIHNESHHDGLKPTQWDVLRYLARANRFSASPTAVTRYLGMTKGTVSQTLIALERKGLIRKTPDSSDRRNVHLDLTPAGRKVLKSDPLEMVQQAVENLPRGQQAGISSQLQSVLYSALNQRGGRPFGLCRQCRHFRTRHEEGKPHFCSLLKQPLSEQDSALICLEQETA